jgi:hypothetical protein
MRSILKAYAAGEIELPRCRVQGARRYAAARKRKPYTVETLAKFTGRKAAQVAAALAELDQECA